MELKFNKNENAGSWVAEFEATADFNLHIEGVIARNVSVLQKTAGGKYDVVHDLPANAPLDKVIDYDFTALIYPKTIKVVCKDEPTYAEVISEGEIVEMKFQEKVVDVTANGSTVVTPDAGFTGLSKVSVKVDVPSSWKYYDVSALGTNATILATDIALLVKGSSFETDGTVIVTLAGLSANGATNVNVSAIAYDESVEVVGAGGVKIAWGDMVGQVISELIKMGAIEITKEEFYNL